MRFAPKDDKLHVAPDGNDGAAVMVMHDGSRILCWEESGKIQSVAFDAPNKKLIVNVDGDVADVAIDDDGGLLCRWTDKSGRVRKKIWQNFLANVGEIYSAKATP